MRRQYVGNATKAYLTTVLGGSTGDLTIYGDDLSNYPDGTVGPFVIALDRNTASEEKILCVSRSGNILTVYNSGGTNGRGYDDTSIFSHAVNAEIEHVFTATDADEANLHVNSSSAVHGLTGTVVGTTDTQTLTNKTLTNPTINGATFSGNVTGLDVGFNPFLLMGA